eukprot:3181617-Alexandrium_andersonii.AAC.1
MHPVFPEDESEFAAPPKCPGRGLLRRQPLLAPTSRSSRPGCATPFRSLRTPSSWTPLSACWPSPAAPPTTRSRSSPSR